MLNISCMGEAMPDGTVVVGTGSVGTRFIDKDYPNTVGLVAGTTKQQEEPSLEETGL